MGTRTRSTAAAPPLAPGRDLRSGLIVAGHGRHYLVEDDAGVRRIVHPRGKRSDCVVGDRVRWAPTADEAGEGVIEALEPRRNLLYRQDDWKTKAFAANLDQVLVMVAANPVFSESQLARALIAAADAAIPAVILLNKADLPEIGAARDRLRPYRAMGVEVVELALKAQPAESRAALERRVAGRTSLILGPSGVGKSTLINLLVPDAGAQVGEVSQALNSGRHTTTHTQWHWAGTAGDAGRGGLIDSPGFQEFGLRHIAPQDLVRRMPDLAAHADGCRFYNCTHRQEPGCTVREAAAAGRIDVNRMRIYEELLEQALRPRPY
jgi:ribosome biogenesis GTPase / thiamine phosphate phosphatase